MAQSNPTGQQRCDLLSSVYGRDVLAGTKEDDR